MLFWRGRSEQKLTENALYIRDKNSSVARYVLYAEVSGQYAGSMVPKHTSTDPALRMESGYDHGMLEVWFQSLHKLLLGLNSAER